MEGNPLAYFALVVRKKKDPTLDPSARKQVLAAVPFAYGLLLGAHVLPGIIAQEVLRLPLVAVLSHVMAAIVASAMPLSAAQAETKIGVVNIARLLQEAPQAQAASKSLEGEFAARRRELEGQQTQLKSREEQLQKDGATMAEAQRRTAEKALRDSQREFARKQNEFLEDLNIRRNEALGQLQRSVLQEVQTYAKNAGLDLVEIAPNGEPPVCRIMDYGKFRFEQAKKAQIAKKKQKNVQVKEVKFRPGTEEADYQVKMRNVHRFLDEGNKVKLTLRFRGREMAHQEIGTKLLDKVKAAVADVAEYAQKRLQKAAATMVGAT